MLTVCRYLSVQGYHGLLSQSMTTERMYGKILTVWLFVLSESHSVSLACRPVTHIDI